LLTELLGGRMKLIFLDESGYSKNWENDIAEQPFHVLSAIAVDCDQYNSLSKDLRDKIESIEDLELEYPLGRGFEIKANEVSKGKGWWKKHNRQRNEVRDSMLSFPENEDDTGFIVVIDKEKHQNKYAFPDPPHEVAFQFMFERIQWYLLDQDDVGICIYDQTKFLDDDMHEASADLMRDGSSVSYQSEFFGYVSKKFQIDRVIEFSLGRSENSIGIQVADYYAHFAYQYYKKEKPAGCGWWDRIRSNLYQKNGEVKGYGLKVFP
jgi:hypothetical protein